ncbi:MAG: hypothetical protein HYS25_02765 [Ignavibacteriales bacterium]|nr:hypothetical protein [Ignavibacteriales bacterium]
MNRKSAGISFFVVCLALAVLLITKTISSTTSSLIFAAALILFGVLSKGFRKQS